MCLFNGHDVGDINEFFVRIDIVDYGERTCDMESVRFTLFIGVEFLFVPIRTGIGILP